MIVSLRLVLSFVIIGLLNIQPVMGGVPNIDCNAARDSVAARYDAAEQTSTSEAWARAAEAAQQLISCEKYRLKALKWTVQSLHRAGRHSRALRVHERLSKAEIRTTEDSSYASRTSYYAYLSSYAVGENSQTLSYIQKASEYAPSSASANYRVQMQTWIASFYVALGQYDQARSTIQNAFDLASRAVETGEDVRPYRMAGLHRTAVDLELRRALDERARCGCTAIFIRKEKADSILQHLQKARTIFQDGGHAGRLRILDAYEAGIHLVRNQRSAARKDARTALTEEGSDYEWARMEGFLMLAYTHLSDGNPRQALATLERGKEILKQTSDQQLVNNYTSAYHRVDAIIQYERGHYGRVAAALWKLKLSDTFDSPHHFRVAEASTVPLVPTTSGFVLLTLVLGAIGFVVSRKTGTTLADLLVMPDAPPASGRLYAGIPLFNEGGDGASGDGDDGGSESGEGAYHSIGRYRPPLQPKSRGSDALDRYDVPEFGPFRSGAVQLEAKLYPELDMSYEGLGGSLQITIRTPVDVRGEPAGERRVRYHCGVTGEPFVVDAGASVPHLQIDVPFLVRGGVEYEPHYLIIHPRLVERGPAVVLDALAWHVRDAYQRHVYDLLEVVRWHDALTAPSLPFDDWPTPDEIVDCESTAFRPRNGDRPG